MTISRVNPAGWLQGEKITPAQVNALDTNVSHAVDGNTTGASGLTIASRSITRVLPYLWQGVVGTWAYAVVDAYLLRTGVATACIAQHPIRVPNGVTITAMSVEISPATHGTKPAVMPQWSLIKYRWKRASPASSVITGVADPSADAEAYSLVHEIPVSGQSVVVDNTDHMYTLLLTTESGANAAANCDVGPVKITYTTARLDED